MAAQTARKSSIQYSKGGSVWGDEVVQRQPKGAQSSAPGSSKRHPSAASQPQPAWSSSKKSTCPIEALLFDLRAPPPQSPPSIKSCALLILTLPPYPPHPPVSCPPARRTASLEKLNECILHFQVATSAFSI